MNWAKTNKNKGSKNVGGGLQNVKLTVLCGEKNDPLSLQSYFFLIELIQRWKTQQKVIPISLKGFFGCSLWHSAALLNPSTSTPLVLSYGCLCPPSSSSVPQLSCVLLWQRPPRHWRGRVNRPVRSPRISVGLECAVAPAPLGDTTLGVEVGVVGGGCCRPNRCSVRERG